MVPSRVDSARRMAQLGVACSATFFVAASVFVRSVFGSTTIATVGYAMVAMITTLAIVLVSAPLRANAALVARRVPKIPGANARWSYRAVSRPRGTVLMGSAPTIV